MPTDNPVRDSLAELDGSKVNQKSPFMLPDWEIKTISQGKIARNRTVYKINQFFIVRFDFFKDFLNSFKLKYLVILIIV